jgi:predicted dehydrogenase
MVKYRAGLIGLGWMGWLYDVATRTEDDYGRAGKTTPMPPLRPDRDPPPTAHPGREGLPNSFADSLVLYPATEMVAACELSDARRMAFSERYPGVKLYEDYEAMVAAERLDIVGISTTAAVRLDATRAAVGRNAKGIITEKPMAGTLEDADSMVTVCADAGVPLICGAVSMNHPALGNARKLLGEGAIGPLLSAETNLVMAQHNSWNVLLDSPGDWVIGVSDDEQRVREGREFKGSGFIRLQNGLTVSLRPGAPWVRITGETGELTFDWKELRLWQDLESMSGIQRVEVPFPEPRLANNWSVIYGIDDLVRCIETGGEPRTSGRRVRNAMEIEIALNESHRLGSVRVDLPLSDRGLGLVYDAFR